MKPTTNKIRRLALLAVFIALAIAVLSVPSSASLKDSGTFEAWVSADSLQNGTILSNKTKNLIGD